MKFYKSRYRCSLSNKGCPSVAESTYESFKKEFVYPNHFQTLEQLKVQLFDYVNW
ncbi:IS3 family transposase [Listeria booriae]|uniref:IS3 family transposase n=2 Tax=Listeria booriae TaxID=1552123 RepID=A0A7X0XWF6_9LIST|nr:IS3 family transposase [Listeria booriae]MBC1797433.1 IS3 family transposase [Listeria booriae]MBC1812015.1 IS3 family transposase [Listeria booriae]MBC2319677.1 IS3 family transposase [Listeria booriae]